MLLRRTHLLVIPAVFAVAVGACTVKEVDDDNFTDSTGVQTGGGGEGATGATGGFGGDGATGGFGGFGGTGVGGSGGTACAGEDGVETGLACTDTGKLPVAAGANACTEDGNTGGDLPPPAIGVCERIYEVYKNGVADAFLSCADDIGTQLAEACSIENVRDCVTFAHDSACPDQAVIDVCDGIAEGCAGFDPPDNSLGGANAGTCAYLVTAFNDTGYAQWETCVTGAPVDNETCLDQVTRCWDEVASAQP
jgi:hypothetical protein